MHLNACRKYQFSLQKLTIIFVICDVLWLHNETFAASAYSSSDNFATKYNDQKMLDVRSKKRQADEVESVTFIEYYMDHEVTEKEARDNLRQLKETEFAAPAFCKPCSQENIKYCHSDAMLQDHCCCNQGHKKEQLFFIPHSCYIGENRCIPSLSSCLTVTEVRQCCCDTQLKKHFKMGFKSDEVFAKIETRLTKVDAGDRKVQHVYKFKITVDGAVAKTWMLDLKSVKLYAGDDSAECTLVLSDETMFQIGTGAIDAKKALNDDLIDIEGNMELIHLLAPFISSL
ncbi:unnamed protein product [Diamesa hyperborea]